MGINNGGSKEETFRKGSEKVHIERSDKACENWTGVEEPSRAYFEVPGQRAKL